MISKVESVEFSTFIDSVAKKHDPRFSGLKQIFKNDDLWNEEGEIDSWDYKFWESIKRYNEEHKYHQNSFPLLTCLV